MILYFLSEDNLRNQAFIKDLVYHFRPAPGSILLHAPFGSVEDTRFVSKRISAYLSEELVVNSILHGDQRKLIQLVDGQPVVRRDLIDASFQQCALLVMNALSADGPVDVQALIGALRATYDISELVLFPASPKSALGAGRPQVQAPGDHSRLIAVYEEEAPVLDRALALAPATIANPATFKA
jgi:hypothetical protein